MRPVYTAAEMRTCDTAAINDYGIPGIVLMEHASRGAADVAAARFGPLAGRTCAIVCGKGNNGGDGFAIARHLANRGMSVRVWMIGEDETVSGDARVNLSILRKMEQENHGIHITTIGDISGFRAELGSDALFAVDALLGTGLSSPLEGRMADIVGALNDSGLPVLAVDMPTGIDADTGAVLGCAVRAACTATMGGFKRGLLFGRGKEYAGEVSVIDLGTPRKGAIAASTVTFQLEQEDIRAWIPRRGYDVHKYQMGKVFVLAGSVGLTGAAAMASDAALRTGAGIVKLGIPESLNDIFEIKLTEVMTIPLKETSERTISLNSYEQILALVNSSTVSIVGPGLSRQYETQNLVRRLVQNAQSPLVLDADALYALAGHLELLLDAGVPLILTPHAGEFARMIDQNPADIESKKIELARTFATEYNVTLVLKGAPTIIGCPDGMVYINSTGNPGMATAGSGDVLTGIIAGLAAQGASAMEAACAGVYIHGSAGDRARTIEGEYGLIATDIVRTLAETLNELAADASPT